MAEGGHSQGEKAPESVKRVADFLEGRRLKLVKMPVFRKLAEHLYDEGGDSSSDYTSSDSSFSYGTDGSTTDSDHDDSQGRRDIRRARAARAAAVRILNPLYAGNENRPRLLRRVQDDLFNDLSYEVTVSEQTTDSREYDFESEDFLDGYEEDEDEEEAPEQDIKGIDVEEFEDRNSDAGQVTDRNLQSGDRLRNEAFEVQQDGYPTQNEFLEVQQIDDSEPKPSVDVQGNGKKESASREAMAVLEVAKVETIEIAKDDEERQSESGNDNRGKDSDEASEPGRINARAEAVDSPGTEIHAEKINDEADGANTQNTEIGYESNRHELKLKTFDKIEGNEFQAGESSTEIEDEEIDAGRTEDVPNGKKASDRVEPCSDGIKSEEVRAGESENEIRVEETQAKENGSETNGEEAQGKEVKSEINGEAQAQRSFKSSKISAKQSHNQVNIVENGVGEFRDKVDGPGRELQRRDPRKQISADKGEAQKVVEDVRGEHCRGLGKSDPNETPRQERAVRNNCEGEADRKDDVGRQKIQPGTKGTENSDAEEKEEYSSESDGFVTGDDALESDGFVTADDQGSGPDSLEYLGDEFYDCEHDIPVKEETNERVCNPVAELLEKKVLVDDPVVDEYDGDDNDSEGFGSEANAAESDSSESDSKVGSVDFGNTDMEQTVIMVNLLDDSTSQEEVDAQQIFHADTPGTEINQSEISDNSNDPVGVGPATSSFTVPTLATCHEQSCEVALEQPDAPEVAVDADSLAEKLIGEDTVSDEVLDHVISELVTSDADSGEILTDKEITEAPSDTPSEIGGASTGARQKTRSSAGDSGISVTPIITLNHEIVLVEPDETGATAEPVERKWRITDNPIVLVVLGELKKERVKNHSLLLKKNCLIYALLSDSKREVSIFLSMLKEHLLRINYLLHNFDVYDLPVSEELCCFVWNMPIKEFGKFLSLVDTIAAHFASPIGKVKSVLDTSVRVDLEISSSLLREMFRSNLQKLNASLDSAREGAEKVEKS